MEKTSYVDLHIQFIGALGLPRTDLFRLSNPYFIAKLDDKVSFVSTIKSSTPSPAWNEIWNVRNVPVNVSLHVEIRDKHDCMLKDHYIGQFQTTTLSGVKEAEIRRPRSRRRRGTFWLKIVTSPSVNPEPHPFLFDGPIRFSQHSSPIIGRFTKVNTAHLYPAWKMYLKGVPLFFTDDSLQHWNRSQKSAKIFQGPTSLVLRPGVRAGYRMLYTRRLSDGFGTINGTRELFHILHGQNTHAGNKCAPCVKPAIYSYVISVEDDSFRFSEKGTVFRDKFASKHALHANCAEAVRYSGEFHLRPTGGWEYFHDDTANDESNWELVIDNSSGTYTPDSALLPKVYDLLKYNFPDCKILALRYDDPECLKSKEACRAYAVKRQGVKPCT